MNNWKNNLCKITPYVPGEQPTGDIIKLNTNENPYAPSPKVKEALRAYDTGKLRLYPSIECTELKKALADTYGIDTENIFLGNGSDEVLALAFRAFFNSDLPVLFPDITYSFYDVWCELFGIKYKRIPLDKNFYIQSKDYFIPNGGIVITNPNAPTSIYKPVSEIEEIVAANTDSIVIVDEAYIDFGGTSAVGLIKKYDNLAVVHTFSKSRQLAGIRVGYLMGGKTLINALDAVKNSFNSYTLNSLSQSVALAAALDKDYLKKTASEIIKTREYTVKELSKLGFTTLPSSANFIFTTRTGTSAKALFEGLKQKGIYVRYFDKPMINDYLRVTIGTKEQMEKFITAVTELINE